MAEAAVSAPPPSSVPPAAHHRPRVVKTPTVLQLEAVECGAASLGMVLGYYGLFVPLVELREACGVSRDGSKAVNVAAAAERFGLRATGMRTEPDELRAHGGPVIIHWRFNHFVVFEGFVGEDVQLNDPAIGRRRVTFQEFDESFTGIAIALEPAPDFQRGGHPFSVTGAIGERLRRRRGGVTLAVLAGILATIPALVAPAFSAVFVNDVLARGDRSFLVPLIFGVVVAGVLRAGATYVQHHYLLRLQNVLTITGSSRVLWKVMRLPMDFFSHRSIPDVASRVDMDSTLAQLLAGQLATLLINALTAVAFVAVMLVYSWELTIVAVVLNVVNVVALRAIIKRRALADERLLKERAALTTTTVSGIQSIESLKATSSESAYFSKWSGELARVLRLQSSIVPSNVLLGAVPAITAALSVAAVIVLGGLMVIGGTLSVGGLVAFQSLVISFNSPVQQIFGSAGLYHQASAQLSRLNDILRNDVAAIYEDERDDNEQWPPQLAGSIELHDVTFGYSPLDPPLVDGLSLTIPAGSRIALVGASGAGKSTIVKLIVGLLEPWSGEVRFDGVLGRDVPPEVWANTFSVVDQNIFLLSGTVTENLTLWDRTIPDSVVRAAAIDAAIDEDITKRPGGYHSLVDEGGRNWSGGQAQRLELARALTNEPRVLVLDEATSALDPIVEQHVDQAIRRRGCTTLVVAHRLSTIRDADRILVLDHGRVIEEGTHEDLVAIGGHYASLVSAGGEVGA